MGCSRLWVFFKLSGIRPASGKNRFFVFRKCGCPFKSVEIPGLDGQLSSFLSMSYSCNHQYMCGNSPPHPIKLDERGQSPHLHFEPKFCPMKNLNTQVVSPARLVLLATRTTTFVIMSPAAPARNGCQCHYVLFKANRTLVGQFHLVDCRLWQRDQYRNQTRSRRRGQHRQRSRSPSTTPPAVPR